MSQRRSRLGRGALPLSIVALIVCFLSPLSAQQPEPAPPPPSHDMHDMPMDQGSMSGWRFMQDGTFDALFNAQGGERSGEEFIGLNWWMGMATKPFGSQQLTLTTMLSLEPATIGRGGYRELFQIGESLDGHPLINRQHPHDLFMQLAAAWRRPLTDGMALTIAGGPVGEATLGGIAFMHRASAAAIPFPPLSHHTFDSTHVTFGVVSAGVDRGRWTVEGSVFNGREPDDNRWDFEFGALDSVAGRVWFRPSPEWMLQVSSGRLVNPEPLERSTVIRTTASAGWLRTGGDGFSAATIGYGVNQSSGQSEYGAFAEWSRQAARTTLSSRFELVQRETHLLLTGREGETRRGGGHTATVAAFTVSALRAVLANRLFQGAIGVSATVSAGRDPSLDRRYGAYPVSFQIYLQVRPPSPRMWNMRMGAEVPASGHSM